MKLLITNLSNYKDKDGIITGFNETGTFSILAKGILNPKSKNACINNPMTYIDLELNNNTKTKYDVLKSAEIIFTPLELIGKLNYLAMVLLLDEFCIKCLNDEEKTSLYKDIVNFLKGFKKNKKPRFDFLNLTAKILHTSGYAFDIDECCVCGSKKEIVGFSMSDGGFICKECLINNDDSNYTKEELIWIRKIFKLNMPEKVIIEEDIDNKTFKKLLKMMIIFIEDNYGLKIKNIELIVD